MSPATTYDTFLASPLVSRPGSPGPSIAAPFEWNSTSAASAFPPFPDPKQMNYSFHMETGRDPHPTPGSPSRNKRKRDYDSQPTFSFPDLQSPTEAPNNSELRRLQSFLRPSFPEYPGRFSFPFSEPPLLVLPVPIAPNDHDRPPSQQPVQSIFESHHSNVFVNGGTVIDQMFREFLGRLERRSLQNEGT